MCSSNLHFLQLGFQKSPNLHSKSPSFSRSRFIIKFRSSNCRLLGFLDRNLRRSLHPIASMDDDFVDSSFGFDEGDEVSEMDSFYLMYSSDDESDADLVVNVIGDVDLPLSKEHHMDTPEAALTLAAHRFASIQRGHRKKRTRRGVLILMGLIAFLALFLSFVDWCSWKIVRLPLQPFYLTQPFSISTVTSACAGCLFVPIADSMKIQKMLKKQGPIRHSLRRKLPTMGGLFFIPAGVAVARNIAGMSSIQVNTAALATLAFGAIGLFDDFIKFSNDHSYRLPGWIKFILQVAAGTWFSFWLCAVDIPTPYGMKFLVPLPPPYGIVYLGKYYLVLTTFCFLTMGNGLNLSQRLDGFAGGVSALAFIGMSIAVLPICPDLALFGASMAGACIGFLFHNRYKASILMGDIGSFALGGALAAMAACTGMFVPLFISSGVFIIEVFSVIVQVIFMKVSRPLYGRALPLHYHLKLWGFKTPVIVASAYVVSSILAMFAGYVGLISA